MDGEVIEWRGPAPYLFLPLDPEDSDLLAASPELSYGWGCVAAEVTVGATTFSTSLMPRQGDYLVPLKVVVQRAEGLGVGDRVRACVRVRGRRS